MYKEKRILWGLWQTSFNTPPPSFLSISHVDPLVLCLKFLIGAEGQAMFITMPWGGEMLRLNQIKTKFGLSGDSLHWLPLVIVLAAMVVVLHIHPQVRDILKLQSAALVKLNTQEKRASGVNVIRPPFVLLMNSLAWHGGGARAHS